MPKNDTIMNNADDKYRDKAIRFYDKGTHYELIYTDDFNHPTSGDDITKPNTVLTDILLDMRNANKDKELHIFVGSYGGAVSCLAMLMQQVLEFKYRVGINLGTACSCGFMLLACCNEIYASCYSEFLYHDMSALMWGKVGELSRSASYFQKVWDELVNSTFVSQILTPEELELGKTSEVFLTGSELIARRTVMDYALYQTRTIPITSNDEFYVIGDSVYRKCGNLYKKYVAEKPCKKNNNNTYSYSHILLENMGIQKI